ncbi:MAG: replicative DNA helicase, partial [Zhongshania marina]
MLDLIIPSDGPVHPDVYPESPPDFAEEREFAQLKLPPHSVEAEQSVLGGLMIANEAWDSVADAVGEGDFFRPEHRKIFAQMARLVQLQQPIDVVTLAEALAKTGELESVGGAAYLADIASNTPSVANIRAYA